MLAALYQLSGDVLGPPVFAHRPLTVVFRISMEGNGAELPWALDVVESAHRSLEAFVDWNGTRRVNEAALVAVGRLALREAVAGARDDASVELAAEELDRVQSLGISLLFLEQKVHKDPTGALFLEALAAMLGERWESPAWQMVRHVLVEPRRY